MAIPVLASEATLARFVELGKKIIGIGRNYAAHAKELGNEAPSKPFFFLKPTTSYVTPPNLIEIPTGSEVHHEVELGVVIGAKGKNIPVERALDYIGGYALALDLTCRTSQAEAKAKSLPWSEAKGRDGFCPVGTFLTKSQIPNPNDVTIGLRVNDATRQLDTTAKMIFNVQQLISHVSTVMTLEPGDLILTGTPKGVGPIVPGDVLLAFIPGVYEMKFKVVAQKPASSL